MEDEDNLYLQQLEAENEQFKAQADNYRAAVTSQGIFNKDPNLISEQIDYTQELIKIEHYLRADVLITDKKGNKTYVQQNNTDLIILNDYGINIVMNCLNIYVSKVNSLSNFPEEQRIYELLADLGDNLRKLIFNNYEKMGMDTAYKKSFYEYIVKNLILDMAEATYRKAFRAKQMEEVNTGRIVNQTMGNPGNSGFYGKPKKWYNKFF